MKLKNVGLRKEQNNMNRILTKFARYLLNKENKSDKNEESYDDCHKIKNEIF
jgi:hypothetical protein